MCIQVAQQCKENIFAIETLRDFQYVEDGKDSGLNVREKAKQLVILLKDDERLRNDRVRALKAKERFAQAASFSSDIVTVSEVRFFNTYDVISYKCDSTLLSTHLTKLIRHFFDQLPLFCPIAYHLFGTLKFLFAFG